MSKKILIKENSFIDLFKTLLGLKAKGKEQKLIQRVRAEHPELGDVVAKWNDSMDKALMIAKDNFTRYGKPNKAKEIDDLIKKYS